MLAAAKAAAKTGGATITVSDANNDPKAQFAQLQTAATSGQYDAIIVQPIFGTGLISETKVAIKKGIKVVDVDQILGPNLTTNKSQVAGLAGNVVQVSRAPSASTSASSSSRRARRTISTRAMSAISTTSRPRRSTSRSATATSAW